jgi:HK97 family phage major capsid protein
MTTISEAKGQNDVRQRAHEHARDILEVAAREGRGLNASEKSAVARCDQIVSEARSVRDDLLRREEALAALDGVRDEFRGRPGVGDLDQLRALRELADRRGGNVEVTLDLAPAARAMQAYQAGARGPEFRVIAGDTSSTSGGSLTEPLDVSLAIYTAMTSASAMRQTRSTILTTSGGETMKFPRVTTQGIATQVATANTVIAGTEPALGVMQLDAFDAGEIITVANDLIEDSGIDVLAWLASAAGRAVGKLVDSWYVTGSGSGMPMGIVNAGGTGSAGTIATGGSLIYGAVGSIGEKLWDVIYSVDSQYRQRGEWLMNDTTSHDLRKLRDGAGGTVGRWLFCMSPDAGLPGGAPDMLCDRPLWIDSNVASLGSAATIAVFGDMSAFYIRDVRGLTVSRSSGQRFDTNETLVRALLRTDSDLIDKTAVNVLRAVVA